MQLPYLGKTQNTKNDQFRRKQHGCYWNTFKLVFTITRTRVPGLVLVSLCTKPNALMEQYPVMSCVTCVCADQATVKNVTCSLMTSHLESTASHAGERKRQLKTAFDAIKQQQNTVVFGGDLNLRDKEVCHRVTLTFDLAFR